MPGAQMPGAQMLSTGAGRKASGYTFRQPGTQVPSVTV
jgi:hypothetical protein